MAPRGITNRGKTPTQKRIIIRRAIGGGNYVQKEKRRRTKRGAISYSKRISQRKFQRRARTTEDSARICARHILPKVVFTKVISRKFQVPPVNWRLALCSVSISARRFRTAYGPTRYFPEVEAKRRRIEYAPEQFVILLLTTSIGNRR